MASSGNFCVINPIGAQGGGTTSPSALTSGNTAATMQTDTVFGNFGVTSGKWYWEWALTGSSNSGQAVGWANQQVNPLAELGYNSPSSATGAQIVYMYLSPSSGAKDIISDAPKSASSGTDSDSTGSVVQNDIISLAADFDNDKWYFAINGSYTAMRSGQNPSDGSNPMCSASGGGGLVTIARTAGFTWFPAMGNWAASTRNIKVNFGQDSTFSGSFSAGGNADENGFGDFKYSVPTGFLAMCSANLPISDDIDPAQTDDNFPQKQCGVVTYTGTGSSNAVSGLGFQPDLVIIKNRPGTQGTKITDSSRGVTKVLQAPTSSAESTDSNGLTAFGSDGFTVGSDAGYNGSGNGMVAWCWRANGGTTASNSDGDITSTVQVNQAAGFSIVQYTGVSSATTATVGHGLGKAPTFIIHKSLNASAYHFVRGVPGMTSATTVRDFNPNGSPTDVSGSGGALVAPTDTTFNINNYTGIGGGGYNYVAYCWAPIEGYSKFGVYQGNSNSDGTFVYTGFRPRIILTFGEAFGRENFIWDSERTPFNTNDDYLRWGRSSAEGTSSSVSIDFLSNGFKARGTNADYNSGNVIYAAWGDVPFKYNNAF